MCLNNSAISGKCTGCVAYKEKVARLEEKLTNWEPWMAGLGRMLVEYRIARFPDDVLAWRTERDEARATNAAVRDELGRMRAWAEDGPQKVWNHIVIEGCKHMLAALSAIAGKGCICGAPGPQPCGPNCNYPYTDRPGKGPFYTDAEEGH